MVDFEKVPTPVGNAHWSKTMRVRMAIAGAGHNKRVAIMASTQEVRKELFEICRKELLENNVGYRITGTRINIGRGSIDFKLSE
jgi:hypothetical protein